MQSTRILLNLCGAAALIAASLHAGDAKNEAPDVNGYKQISAFPGLEDFKWVKRDGYKLPAFKSDKPRFTFWALGGGQKSVALMVWDESGGPGKGYDTFYFDKNFNGDLTEAGESAGIVAGNPPAADLGTAKEADGPHTYHIKFIAEKDNFEWRSEFDVGGPDAQRLSLLPGNLKIQFTNDIKTAPVYRLGGGPAVVMALGKHAGEELGTLSAGKAFNVWLTVSLFGSSTAAELRYYHSQPPPGRDPQIMLRVKDPQSGATVEEIPFTGGCGCAGSFGQELLIPSRVPPGKHEVVVRIERAASLGGNADYLYPVKVENADFGKALVDPAYTALKAKFASANIVSLRRAATTEAGKAFPEEILVPSTVADDTLYGNTRDWNMSPINQGGEVLSALGTLMHHNNDARTLLKFDLAALPKDAKISGALIRIALHTEEYIGTKGGKIDCYPLLTAWVEKEACWNAPSKAGKWGAPGGDGPMDHLEKPSSSTEIAAYPAKDEKYRFVTIDVTEIAKKWQAGTVANNGVMLKWSGDGCVKFRSSEFQDFVYRPTLVLAYEGTPLKSAAVTPVQAPGKNTPAAKTVAKK